MDECRKKIIEKYASVDAHYVQRMYRLWEGAGGHLTKKDIESKFFGDERSNGKQFNRLVKLHLNIDVEAEHPMSERIAYLESLLKEHGIPFEVAA
jgi:hypothetical protein